MAQSVFKEHSFFEEDDTALDEDFAEELEDFSFSALELSGFAESLDFAELLDFAVSLDLAEELEDVASFALELSGFAESLDFAELLDAADFTLLELFSSEDFSSEAFFADELDFAEASDFADELLAASSFTKLEDFPFFALLEISSSAEELDSSSTADEISSTSESEAEELESSPQAERQSARAKGSQKSLFINILLFEKIVIVTALAFY